MTPPKRIQLRRIPGWRKPQGAIVVARPTKWGNPCRWASGPVTDGVGGSSECTPAEARAIAADGFRRMLADPEVRAVNRYPSDAEIRAELAGRDLACWCPLSSPCHADVLLELANTKAVPDVR